MQVIRLSGVSSAQWRALQGDEPHPWGGEAEALEWAEKHDYVGIEGEDGELRGIAAALVADVSAGGVPFQVAGLGGLIVRPEDRSRGLAHLLAEAILDVARGLGPDKVMLFCRAPLMVLYAQFGFQAIEATVTAAQPGGRVEMPLPAMWAPLRDGASWPPGAVEVLGEPF